MTPMIGAASLRRSAVALASLGALGLSASPVLAHGPVPAEAPTVASLLLGWIFEPLPTLAIGAATWWWLWAVRRVNVLHPANPVPRQRTAEFLAAMAALAFALLSGIGRYDTSLFSVHMVQHVLLTLVAAPLLALSAPITLMLRLASPSTRQRWLLPVLHSGALRVLSFPVTAWILFAGVMWASHFSALFNAALEDPLIHDLEHGLFLSSALLFWWPAVALDPAPWRLAHPARIGYVALQMTQNTFLAFVLLNVPSVLYLHYATLVRPWGPSPLDDQQLAAAVMWVTGDLIFIGSLMALGGGWMRAEGRSLRRADREAEIDLAQIRVREQRLAERLASERGDGRG
ncbi:MAG TPA: cytochrome c oxidase assembly protein [Candidatus Limnocylindrales bacterium]|nr:cytochrome c oxidase assembly protein [Candidatus Limnocylindrales bacterium]